MNPRELPLIVLDFETFFSEEYTLNKMTTESYIRDARFEPLGLGWYLPGKQLSGWVNGPDIAAWLQGVQLDKYAVAAHHAHFDGLILSHHYKVRPGFWYDTLSCGRVTLGVDLSLSLESLAKHFDMSSKTVPYNLFKGKHYAELDGYVMQRLSAGCMHDCALTFDILKRLAPLIPRSEFQVMDTTIRMFTEPVLELDLQVLGDLWYAERERRFGMLEELGVTAAELSSNAKFADLLTQEGVEIEYKEGKRGPIPAFGKKDKFMEKLLNDTDNDRIHALVSARLGVKSTLDQTRAERFGEMGSRGAAPVYLRYCGAHTTRWSGGDKTNWQNLRRGGKLRQAVKSKAGQKLVVADSSQIECRILNEFAGQYDVVAKFRNKEDPYVGTAAVAYGREITKDDKAERGTGKQLELSCGYGAGDATIQNTARIGTYGPSVHIDLETARRWKDAYRSTHPAVVDLWREAEIVISRMAAGESFWWRCLFVDCRNEGRRRIYVPGYPELKYDTLEWRIPQEGEYDENETRGYWRYKDRRGWWAKLYGGKLVENVVQYMARLVISDAMNRITDHGIAVKNTTHDELVCVVPAAVADQAYAVVTQEMCKAPEWMPDLPLDSEGGVTDCYGDVK